MDLTGLSVYVNTQPEGSRWQQFPEYIGTWLGKLGARMRLADPPGPENGDLFDHLVDGADIFLWLSSLDTLEDSASQRQLEIAAQSKPLVPLSLQGAPLPAPLQDIQAIYLRDDEEETLQQLALAAAWKKIKANKDFGAPRKRLLPDIDRGGDTCWGIHLRRG